MVALLRHEEPKFKPVIYKNNNATMLAKRQNKEDKKSQAVKQMSDKEANFRRLVRLYESKLTKVRESDLPE